MPEIHTIRLAHHWTSQTETIELKTNPVLAQDILDLITGVQWGMPIPKHIILTELMPNGTAQIIGRNSWIKVRDHMAFSFITGDDND